MANKYRLIGGQHQEGSIIYKGPFEGSKGDMFISESDMCGRFPNKFELVETNVAMPVVADESEDEPDDTAEGEVVATPTAPKVKTPAKAAKKTAEAAPVPDASLLTEDDVTEQFPDAAANGYTVSHVDAPHAKGGGYYIRKAGSDENLAGGAKVKLQVAPTLEKLILGDL